VLLDCIPERGKHAFSLFRNDDKPPGQSTDMLVKIKARLRRHIDSDELFGHDLKQQD
jgi:hypothetical protein